MSKKLLVLPLLLALLMGLQTQSFGQDDEEDGGKKKKRKKKAKVEAVEMTLTGTLKAPEEEADDEPEAEEEDGKKKKRKKKAPFVLVTDDGEIPLRGNRCKDAEGKQVKLADLAGSKVELKVSATKQNDKVSVRKLLEIKKLEDE